jgi:hypothetical protein
VGLFRRDPWKEGTRTDATVERVTVTNTTHNAGADGFGGSPVVFLTFRFTGADGQQVMTHERKLAVGRIPLPGSTVKIAYLPDKLNTIEFDDDSILPPDPSVPRGWGAGIFEIEDLGTHRSGSAVNIREFEAQRELFRTGQRAQAEVQDAKPGILQRRQAAHYTFTLNVDGQELQTKAWAIPYCAPGPGDMIQIATNADRSQVALDTDERFDAPPGQGLVFTMPPEVAAARDRPIVGTTEPSPAGFNDKYTLAIQQIDDLWARRGITHDNWQMMRGNLVAAQERLASRNAPAAGAAPAPDITDQLKQLGDLHAAGSLTDAEFADAKQRLLSG